VVRLASQTSRSSVWFPTEKILGVKLGMALSSAKRYRKDTHRAVPPSETLERVWPLLPRMGITRVANVTGLDRIGIPVVMVTRPNSRSVSVAQGKGLTLETAKASGVMEAIETWHAERITLPLRYSSLADISADSAAADVARLPWLRGARFTDRTRILWIAGRDLAAGTPAWVPFEMVHTDYTRPSAPGHGCFPSSSNGLASGNSVIEATCHALCELIERDATSVWHHLPAEARGRTRVRPDTVDDPACAEVIGRIEAAGIELAVWETTTDVGVAAFRAVIAEPVTQQGHIGIGDGCHPNRGIALLRALTEAVQTRMTYISGARDDMTPDEFTPEALASKGCFVRAMLDQGRPGRDFAEAPNRDAETFEDDLGWLMARLEGAGCGQVLAVDLTQPGIGISVVRAVVPGLEAPHDDDGYVPGERATAAAGAET